MKVDTVLPVAETFYSIQGEGHWAGFPMFFVRLAGCNVGRYVAQDSTSPFQQVNPQYATCKSFTGEEFICDTDYRVKEKLTVEQILDLIPKGCQHVSITGGEPLIHESVKELVAALDWRDIVSHIETSGTKLIKPFADMNILTSWITCAPKWGYLQDNTSYINEFKFLVRWESDAEMIRKFILANNIQDGQDIFIQPIDEMIRPDLRSINIEADVEANRKTFNQLQIAVQVVKNNPDWILSPQMHKFLGVR